MPTKIAGIPKKIPSSTRDSSMWESLGWARAKGDAKNEKFLDISLTGHLLFFEGFPPAHG